jgi:hypothetical protein
MTPSYQATVESIEQKRVQLSKRWVLLVVILAGSIPLSWVLQFLHALIINTTPGFEESFASTAFLYGMEAYGQMLIVGIALIVYDYFRRDRIFKKLVATELFKPLFNHYFPHLKYSYEAQLTSKDLQAYPLFGNVRFNACKLEDAITGTYKGQHVQIHEAEMTYTTRKGDKNVEVDLFKGLIVEVDFPVDTGSTTLVYTKGTALHKRRNRIGEVVDLESVRFMDQFSIHATNQRDARLHLKTHFMARLLDFMKTHRRHVHVMFHQGKLAVFLSQEYDLFAPRSLFVPVKIEQIHTQLSEDTQLIKSMLNDLSLKRV